MPRSEPPDGVGGAEHFAAVLTMLFRTHLHTTEDGQTRPYRLREVAQGTDISIGYLSEARRGNMDNPSLDKLLRLARFFGVSPTVFLEPVPRETPSSEGTAVSGDIEAHIEARDSLPATDTARATLGQIAFRAESFSEVELSMVREMMEVIARHRSRDSDNETDLERGGHERRHSPTDPELENPGG